MNAIAAFPIETGSWLESYSPGAGLTAFVLKKQLSEVRRHSQERALDWEKPIRVSLKDIAHSCAISNWDGHGAPNVSPKTIANAYALASILARQVSPGIPAPDLVPEPDGEIALSWDLAPEMVFSVSIGETGRLNYAGIIGHGTERHGGEPFIPGSKRPLKTIISTLEELFELYRAQTPRRT